ncbi:MAG: ATP-dependent protease subunit HslV [Eubacterium aggregans]|uniref:ATP-dependent protease subunit HslV n=1 Tax=Eubacterium aggregans TaxID=81409 RepID=A0A1H3YD03_9FIRM|nr:ATP-dependent protease subunit HslV [Eubacterium aggregans]MDD4691303.1 ATP-dependent protease subunit HslV [Eubacterium aggregans]MEA5072793.1 ATP-dependent protease subunit HslV [Eubacterium aggregans]SEA09500.1 ATP dependent peptidase CodWX, CodW component. Threonine peptidase. MEROPS family T01B [Eubacterium aggregans]
MKEERTTLHATTIVGIRHNGQVAIAGDGQVTMGESVIMKATAKKIRRLYNDQVLTGFAGSVADAFTLCDLFEQKLEQYNGNLKRSAVELAKEWRSDKVLRKLEAMLIVMDKENMLIVSGTGEVIEPDDDIAAIGSGGFYAMSAARALKAHSPLSASEIVYESMKIASEICVFTNDNIIVESL